MYVYKYCLVSDTEISLDIGRNMYHVVHDCTYNHPPLIVKVPANFSYPSSTHPCVIFVPPAPSGFADQSTGSQIIPLASVVEPRNVFLWPWVSESAKNPFQLARGIYIGPINRPHFSYLPPCSYTLFARLLQTCKTVYAEALPVLYSKNRFALHHDLGRDYLLSRFTGRPLEHMTNLRLEVISLKQLLYEGGSNSVWSIMLRRCTQIRKVTLSFPDYRRSARVDYIRAIARIAASIADIRKGTGEPAMIVKAVLGTGVNLVDEDDFDEFILGMKKYPKMRVPRGTTLELMGGISVWDLRNIQKYSRKGWRFERRSPENDCDIKAFSWVELAWVKS